MKGSKRLILEDVINKIFMFKDRGEERLSPSHLDPVR